MLFFEWFAPNYWPAYNSSPELFIGSAVVFSVLSFVAGWLTNRAILSNLQRVEHRMSVRQFYSIIAARHTANGLALRLLLSLGVVAIGHWFSRHPAADGAVLPPGIAWLCMIIMGVCAMTWVYALVLKLTNQSSAPMAPSGRGSP